MRRRPSYPHIASTLALVVALGSGGAYAAGLAKNSVGSAQVKNGAIKAKDVKAGTLTGVQVKDGSVTGADVDESTLDLPAQPTVFEGPYVYNATLSSTWSERARITVTVPADGLLRLEAEATLGANPAAAAGGYVDTLFYIDDDGTPPFEASGAYTLWGSPDPTGTFVQHPTATDVVAVEAGTYVVTVHMREHLAANFSTIQNAKIDAMYFPSGSAVPPIT